jgi:hypothetical protein
MHAEILPEGDGQAVGGDKAANQRTGCRGNESTFDIAFPEAIAVADPWHSLHTLFSREIPPSGSGLMG